jgi:hypothetical protein
VQLEGLRIHGKIILKCIPKKCVRFICRRM